MARTFADAAARAAYSIDPVYEANTGKTWLQIDTNTVYRPVRGGAGSENWEELYALDDLTTVLPISLHTFREVDANGDVGAITANGGLLASDTTPIMRGDANESSEISWAAANVDKIATQIALPYAASGGNALDDAQDVKLELDIYSGTTDAATFTVETSWNGAALVSDTATDSAASATRHTITATIAAADVPASAKHVTIILTPAAHATDAIQLVGARLIYERKRAA